MPKLTCLHEVIKHLQALLENNLDKFTAKSRSHKTYLGLSGSEDAQNIELTFHKVKRKIVFKYDICHKLEKYVSYVVKTTTGLLFSQLQKIGLQTFTQLIVCVILNK